VAGPWTSTSYVALTASSVRWRIEQAEAFREQVEHYTDAERVLLADAYQALLRYGPLPYPSSRWRSTGSAIRGVLDAGCCVSIRDRTYVLDR
jgi:hypothetical protein